MASKKNFKADVKICYVNTDAEFLKYLAGGLTKAGLSVWYVDPSVPPAKASSLNSQAVVDCKAFLMILSEDSANCQTCKDELALAYISDKSIFPIGRKWFGKIAKHMDGGMKLMLAKINWQFFVKEEQYQERMDEMTQSIKNVLAATRESMNERAEDDDDDDEEVIQAYDLPMNEHQSLATGMEYMDDMEEGEQQKAPEPPKDSVIISDFWERHFQSSKEATFVDFREQFINDYGERITRYFGEDKKRYIVNLLYKDIFLLNKTISKATYTKFMGKNTKADPDHFFERLSRYAIGNLAMREVFDMDSSVRLTAIQNLGTFQTPAVVASLFTLVEDPDPNIRAVAELALAKSGRKSRKIEDKLIKLLNDEDRLVRESACLSLAHMKCLRAVPNIVDLWRNDAIKHVREAAELALSRIGGEDSAEAIKVTKVLSEEMDSLRKSSQKT